MIGKLNELLESQKSFIPPPLNLRMDIQRAYLKASGLDLNQIDSLNIIHVAGSKGKGSTCTYIESILRKEGYRTGLATSPHLINVEERIRINGQPVDRDVFVKHFWDLHDDFEANKPRVPAVVLGNQQSGVMEVFIGRANAVKCPLYIAPSFDVIESEARGLKNWELLKQKMLDVPIREKNIALALSAVSLWHSERDRISAGVKTSYRALSAQVVGRFQEINVSENVHFFMDCAHTVESMKKGYRFTKAVMYEIVNLIVTPGSLRINIVCPQVTYPHRSEKLSVPRMICCSKWFRAFNESSKPDEQSYKILLFTVTGSRNPFEMLSILEKLNFDAVYFVDYVGGALKRLPGKTPQLSKCVEQWQKINSSTPCYELTNENFVRFISQMRAWDGESTLHFSYGVVSARKINILTVGSVYLVGDVLKLLNQPLKWT
ncbi:hypothetical protein ACTXT7_008463 [Hymenolepis weldensis]